MRAFLRIVPIVVVLVAVTAAPVVGQQDSTDVGASKAAAIRTLLELTKVSDMVLLGVEQALDAQQSSPDMPPGFLEAFTAQVRARVLDFVDMLVPIYADELTLEDVNQLIVFYRTPLGQRFIEAQPRLMQKTMASAERWGMMVAGETLTEMAKQGKPIR